jgi:hypothetical protein
MKRLYLHVTVDDYIVVYFTNDFNSLYLFNHGWNQRNAALLRVDHVSFVFLRP